MPDIRATYRLQLNSGFGFDDAAGVCGYLKSLGISHVYCSPYLQAAPGSTHGYDVVNPGLVNEELGGAAAHARFLARLKESGLGQVLDIVPNHMAIGRRQCVVVGRARKRPGERLRFLLRCRLAIAGGEAPQQDSCAGARRSLWPNPFGRKDPAAAGGRPLRDSLRGSHFPAVTARHGAASRRSRKGHSSRLPGISGGFALSPSSGRRHRRRARRGASSR